MKFEEVLPLARKGEKITCDLLVAMETIRFFDLKNAALSFDKKEKTLRIYRKLSNKRWETGTEKYWIPARMLNEEWRVTK